MHCLLHYLKGILSPKILPVVLSFIFSFLVFNHSNTPVSAQTVSMQDQVMTLINQERGKNGLPSYNKSDRLIQSSLKHNQTMYNCSKLYAFNSCFSHQVTVMNEPTLMGRISATGYNPQAVSENIGWGQTSSQQIVSAWMGSTGHRAAILNSTYKDVGCSLLNTANGTYSGMWWSCNFGKSFSIQPSASPSPSPKPSASPSIRPSASPSVKPSASPSIRPSVSPSVKPSASPSPRPLLTPPPTPSPDKPWWCPYQPTSRYCQ
jgi:serralysin